MRAHTLMRSVSSVALIVAGGQQAYADGESVPSGYTLDVKGGIGGTNSVWNDKFEASGAPDKLGTDDNALSFMGSFSLSRQTAPNKDMTFGLSFGTADHDAFSISSGFGSSFATYTGSESFTFAALDYERGTTSRSGATDLRWFYGARALTTKSSLSIGGVYEDKFGSGSGASFTDKATDTYVGIGPRVGAEFTTRPSGSQFGVSGDVAAAFLLGSLKSTYSSSYSSGGSSSSYSSSYSEKQNAMSLDARIGVDYYLTDTATVSAGFQMQQLWNVDWPSDTDNDDDYGSPRLVKGVYVGFSTQF
ncbi:MAG: Lpg1974 family pore-forming outer membrane protein [Pacificibacter sp.]|uniref:Lpg1974 family pore-forming outer membrane protein n=1 Tax=Pacificibacter sp. TaxID=1917866 RepID=UPI00321A88B6